MHENNVYVMYRLTTIFKKNSKRLEYEHVAARGSEAYYKSNRHVKVQKHKALYSEVKIIIFSISYNIKFGINLCGLDRATNPEG